MNFNNPLYQDLFTPQQFHYVKHLESITAEFTLVLGTTDGRKRNEFIQVFQMYSKILIKFVYSHVFRPISSQLDALTN